MASCEWVGTPRLTDLGNREAIRGVGSITSAAALGLQWVKSAIQSRNIKGWNKGGGGEGELGVEGGGLLVLELAGRRGSSFPLSILLEIASARLLSFSRPAPHGSRRRRQKRGGPGEGRLVSMVHTTTVAIVSQPKATLAIAMGSQG